MIGAVMGLGKSVREAGRGAGEAGGRHCGLLDEAVEGILRGGDGGWG